MSKRLAIILLLILSTLPLLDLFHSGLPITHDGQDHVARIANFYQSLSEGNLVPRWAANLNWGFGHPILMFLYPLPSYIGSLFHFIGFSLVDSTKLVFAVGFIASTLAMFFWVASQWGTFAGLVAGLLYGFAPYRFVDLYIRGAIGEHIAFVFPPIIFYGLLMLARQKKTWKWGAMTALSTAALVLSHNAVSLMFLPLIVLYGLYLYFFEVTYKKCFIVQSVYAILLGFALSAFFWVPAFFEGKYTLRDIVTKGTLVDRFVPFSWFLYSPWNYGGGSQFSKSLGFFQWVTVGASLVMLWQSKINKNKWFLGITLLILFLSLLLMTSWSAILWEKISLFQKFQFPWRLLTVSVFTVSLLGALVASSIPRRLIFVATIISVTAIFFSTYQMWHSSLYSAKPQEFYTSIYDGTTDTGESSPIWSVRFMEKRPAAPLEVIEGDANIIIAERTTTKHLYNIDAKKKSRILENTLYFPGWEVLVDGRKTDIEFQDPGYRGLMTFMVEFGTHSVAVVLKDTKLRMFANQVSIAGFVVLIGSVIIPVVWKRK